MTSWLADMLAQALLLTDDRNDRWCCAVGRQVILFSPLTWQDKCPVLFSQRVSEMLCLSFQPTSTENCAEAAADIIAKRAIMMEHLLDLLNNAADLGVGPSLNEFRTHPDNDTGSRPSMKRFAFILAVRINDFLLLNLLFCCRLAFWS